MLLFPSCLIQNILVYKIDYELGIIAIITIKPKV